MKMNKNQALYRALPNCWITYSDSEKSDYKYACEVIAWNTKRVTGINEDIIRNDIVRRINSFSNAGGIVKPEEFSSDLISNFEFVEPAMNEGISDIVCKINPTTFYCQRCDTVIVKNKASTVPICPNCSEKTRTNQLQMVYACECGFAEGVKPFSKETLFYHSKDKDNQFKFFTKKGFKIEMKKNCPVCNKTLLPKNAIDSRLFYSQSGNIVNLYNEKYSDVLKKYKSDAEILMLAKWFDLIDNSKFLNILDYPKDFFEHKSKDVNDPDIQAFAKMSGMSPEDIVKQFSLNETNVECINKIRNDINHIIPLEFFSENNLKLITSDLMEFDTLKYPKGILSLDDAISHSINAGTLVDENDVFEMLKKLHIKTMQVSEQVQIVNYAYGFTRLRSCPDGSDSTANLRLRGFNGKVFTTILETEGILVELDMISIYSWLIKNKIIMDDEIVSNEEDAKKWFVKNIHLDSITHFSTIDGNGNNRATKVVYSLLHTIAHMMIISAGKHSGLSRDSISEIIFPNAASFFIYPTSSEGLTLGSISGMFETNLLLFLEDALKENEICTFDPICLNSQNGACVACAYLSEVNCTHFNKDLSRAYLYGGTIKKNDEIIEIKKGFWK